MAWRTVNVKQQRIEFVVAVSRKQSSLSRLCQEFEISRPTGYRWWRRYQQKGVEGIEERSRRPQHSPGRAPLALEQRVVELRRQRPDWGARKIHCQLERENIGLQAGTIHPHSAAA